MSLHKFADMVASKGRGDDSLLIHMTPDEVQRLQSFAEANGRSLTINPETGLPEAGMLSDLFKAVAPIALGAFLGPGAFGIAGLGMSAGTAGLVTGGLTTLATGSLSRGLMAGLGAYGGAGLAEGLMGAGVGAAQQSAMGSLSADQIAAEMANTELTKQGVLNQAAADATKSAMANTGQAVSSGFNAVTSTPSAMGAFAKQNLGNIAAAAAPIMAGAMVPTTTKMPENTNPAYIRQKLYDPYTQTYKSLAPIKASEFGNRNFSDAYTNPQTGQMATLDQRQPTPMASGGIVALASGGVSDADIFKYFQTPNLSDTQIAADMQKYGVSAADIARATGTQNQQADYEKRFVNTLVSPTTDASEFQKATSAVGLQDQALATAMQNAGLSGGAQYALTQPAQSDVGFTGGIIDAGTGKPVELYNQIGYTAGALPGDQAGLEGLYGNINYVTSGLQNLINTGKMSVGDAQNAAIAELTRTKVSMGDVEAATGKKFGDLFKPKPVTKIDDKTTVTGGTGKDVITGTGGTGTGGTGTGTGINTGVIPGGFYGNATNPGDITTNPDGTVTVQPNIPYRPTGGFSGMTEVRDAYTKGGGSLGYTAPVPKTAAEHDRMYNTLTDDSLDAYKFLMGKGKNLAQTNAARSRPLMQPYFTESNRYKPKFLSYGKDGEITSSTTSGKPADVKAADLTKAKTIDVVDSSGYDTQTYTAVLQEDGTYLAGNGKRYDVTGKELAAGGGMMGYAMGGGLGSLGSYSDGGRLLKGPGDGVSDSIPATIGAKQQPARLADGEFVIPARIVSELGNGSTEAGAKKLYAMMDRVQRARGKTTGKNKVAANSRADKYLPA
jgi:hypothetical protein